MDTADPLPLQVRHATVADVDVLADLATRAFIAAVTEDNDPEQVERYAADAFSSTRLRADLREAGSRFLLAYDVQRGADPPIGYAQLRIGARQTDVVGEHPIELARIYLHPDETGRGYGSSLLAACLDEAARAGGDVIWLGVWEHNDRARRFYEHRGFRRVGEQIFILGTDAQTDHVMARPVQPTTPATSDRPAT